MLVFEAGELYKEELSLVWLSHVAEYNRSNNNNETEVVQK